MPKDPTDITPQEARALLDDGGVWLLLDCREPAELALARIDGAVHIPMGDIPGRLQELDPDQPTIVFCHHGVRSRSVAHFLARQEFQTVRSMAGGIDAWSRLIDSAVPRYR